MKLSHSHVKNPSSLYNPISKRLYVYRNDETYFQVSEQYICTAKPDEAGISLSGPAMFMKFGPLVQPSKVKLETKFFGPFDTVLTQNGILGISKCIALYRLFHPDTPPPILVIVGPSPTANTNLAELIGSLAGAQNIQANNPKYTSGQAALPTMGPVVVDLANDQSLDFVCRAARDTATDVRKLYTGSEIESHRIRTPIIATSESLDFLNQRPDLLCRVYVLELAGQSVDTPINHNLKMLEKWKQFYLDRFLLEIPCYLPLYERSGPERFFDLEIFARVHQWI